MIGAAEREARARADQDEDDVLAGLSSVPKRLPSRLLYDPVGAALFEEITRLAAYYPTRLELELLGEQVPALARDVGPRARVIEPGSGEGVKSQVLLRGLDRPAVYVPIDVAGEQLARAATRISRELAPLEVQPVVADFSRPMALPVAPDWRRTLVFFPGSTIGNFEHAEAVSLLARLGRLAGPRSLLLLGADGTRDEARLLRAYDDENGVTAAFDKNVLAHLNRVRGATFDLDAFEHRAIWNATASRIEMHLVSTRAQRVRMGTKELAFAPGESIITEHCYKHPAGVLTRILGAAGWRTRRVFTARELPFRLWLCERRTG